MPKYRLFPTSQVKGIVKFFNIKHKLLFCNADIKFNQACLAYKVTPKYATIKCTGNRIPCVRTKQTAENIRIKNEFKFFKLFGENCIKIITIGQICLSNYELSRFSK
jgi:hypothetical protein